MLIAGRYQLNTTIGRGAMGEVWRAYDQMLGRDVAVKVLLAQNADPTADSRFRLEAQTAGRLHHPHVVGVIDFGEHEGRLFLVMEFVDGDSLARVLSDDGPLPAERVAHIATQAAAGLAVAHEQGIVHRDIKPGNLLVDANDNVKIGDFGIARFMDDPSGALTATGQIVGTSLYIAPERALGKPAGPASDVYSLGCVLYQLLTGRPPFRADTAIAILHQHLDAAPVPPRELGVSLPPAFENYLLSLLAKRPEDRPTARQAADWFGSGAWRGRPEPLPAAAPQPRPAPAVAPGPPVLPRPETGPATTYKLPSAGGVPGRRAAHRQRPSTVGHRERPPAPAQAPAHRERPSTAAHRERSSTGGGRRARPSLRATVASRPRAIGLIAAVLIFLAAMFIGRAWFSPDSSSAETPGPRTSGMSAPLGPQTASPLPSSPDQD
ncbi:serine/threonine-protein kinase [Streptomyces yaanensis]|uniref:non-specific serine/threonine protein kinase n=1 Tax=Streptomyces yaanensis TaxID=1142239 RepID=A0ABV7SBG1_9ACTN|nr:serine/threonine-protein kinase [Streptomyces sp. CGMCC 4.7035]WNC02962.1 serine/threonine-protein kinase [Streptomyces sp. CGMCC 4.7035]